jgi:hypothetical protein
MLYRDAIFGLLLLAATVLRAAEVLDRLVVTVNGHAILQSDWQDEVRYESFVAGRSLTGVTPQDRKGALDRLIDQELLREQMNPAESVPTSPEEVEKQLEAIKSDYAGDHGAVPWRDSLASYRLTETDVKNHIALELSQLRLVDARLRPAIQIEAGDIEAYYKDHFGSQAAGSQKISLQAATPKIRELLTQEKINELLSAWLESLHSQAQIKMFVPDSATEGPVQ